VTDVATLLASVVAGRMTPVVPTDRERTYSDGEVIYMGRAGGLDGVVVQASLIAAGSLHAKVATLAGRRGSRARYLTLEATRAADVVRDVAPRRVLARVDALLDGPRAGSADESLRRAGSSPVPEAPDWCGEVRPAKLVRATSADASHARAREAELQELDDDDADDADRSRVLDLLAAPINNPLAAKFASLLGMGGAPRGDDGQAGDDSAMRGNRQARGLGQPTAAAAPTAATGRDGLPTGRRYPEWAGSAYRDDWCAVAEFVPQVAPELEPLPLEPDMWLRKHLAQLGLSPQPHRRQPDGDALDVTALIDFASHRSAGRTGDARVYEQRRSTAHDLAVLVLLDASGSTGESTDGRQIFAGQRALAGRLTAELEALGNRVATAGFYSRGKDDVRFLRVKAFDETYGYEARRRLAAVAPRGFTRLGAAVRHATHVLRTEGGTTNLALLVVGDGLPYDDGYEHRYAHEDTRRALAEAVADGVGCACIAMRSTTHADVLDRVWGHVAHCHLDHPHELARHVRPLLRRALGDARAHRREVAA
jgi:nitric oxide reductase activation protein